MLTNIQYGCSKYLSLRIFDEGGCRHRRFAGHFADPAGILRITNTLLPPTGEVLVSFGTTWYHPWGGHLFSVFPWAHLIFSEKALIRWRSTFKTDGATRFSEVAGGPNQMTIAKFEELVAGSPLRFASLELVPITKLHVSTTA